MKRYFGLFVMVAMLVLALGCQMPGTVIGGLQNGSLPADQQTQLDNALSEGKGAVVIQFNDLFPATSRSMNSLTGDTTFAQANIDVVDIYMWKTGSTPIHALVTAGQTAVLATNVAGTYNVTLLAGKTIGSKHYLLAAGDGSSTVTIVPGQQSGNVTVTPKTTTFAMKVYDSAGKSNTDAAFKPYTNDTVTVVVGGDYGSASIQATECNVWAGTAAGSTVTMHDNNTWGYVDAGSGAAHGGSNSSYYASIAHVPTGSAAGTYVIMPFFNGLEIPALDYIVTGWSFPEQIPYSSVGSYWFNYVSGSITLTVPDGQVTVGTGTVTVGTTPTL